MQQTCPRAGRLSVAQCHRCGIQVCWVNLMINLVLSLLKGIIGILADSRALLALSLYSINDAFSAGVVIASVRLARRPADRDHAYGHGKAEFVAVGILSIILGGAVIFFVAFAIGDIVRGVETPPHVVALLVAGVTLAINYYISRWESCAAAHMASPALETAAEHNRADAISSVLTIIGVSGAMLGFRLLDPIVAIVESVDIMRLSGSLMGTTIKGLMDTALPPEEVAEVRRAAGSVPGVLQVVGVRTRRSGPQAWVDLELALGERLTVAEAEAIATSAREKVLFALQRPAEVQVKIQTPAGTQGASPALEASHA